MIGWTNTSRQTEDRVGQVIDQRDVDIIKDRISAVDEIKKLCGQFDANLSDDWIVLVSSNGTGLVGKGSLQGVMAYNTILSIGRFVGVTENPMALEDLRAAVYTAAGELLEGIDQRMSELGCVVIDGNH